MINGRDHRIDFFRGLALIFIFGTTSRITRWLN